MSLVGAVVHDGGMNWPPPPPAVDSSDATDTSPPQPPSPAEPDSERRRNSATPAAAWIALLGSGLVLVAAVAVVASSWDTIGQSLRVAGLSAVTGLLLLLAERARPLVPTTAGIVAHAGTCLTGFAAIAVMSLFGFTWPACLVVGGLTIAGATAFQAPRWKRVTMHAAQVGGLAIAATGAAALLDTTAGLLAALVSVVMLATGSHHRSVGLALLAVLSPILTALADAGIGDGTLERAGLVGERLSWSGPIVGLLAATVLGVVALRRRNNPLMLIASVAPVLGVVSGLAAIDGSAIAWWCVPALLVLAGELGWWLLPADRFKSAIGTGLSIVAATVAVGAWFGPAFAVLELDGSTLDHPWAVPLVATALAVALATLRWRQADSMLADVGIAGIAAAAVGVFVAFDVHAVVVAVIAVAITGGAAFASRRLSPLAIYPTAFWALVAIAEIDPPAEWTSELIAPLSLLAVLVTVVAVVRSRLAAAMGFAGWIEISATALATVAVTHQLVPGFSAAAIMAATAFVVLAVCVVDSRHNLWGLCAIGAAGLYTFGSTEGGAAIDSTYWIGWAAAGVAFATIWLIRRSPEMAFAGAATSVLTLAMLAAGHGVSAEDFTLMAMVAVVAVTGLTVTIDRRTPLDAAAVTAGVMLVATTGFDMHPAWVSAAWVVIGLQIATFGSTLRSVPAVAAGAGVSLVAALSWIWTTGFDEWFVEWIEPADIRSDDVWFALVSVAALVAGLAARSTMRANTWLAYSAAMTIPALWLTGVELDRSPVWAIPLLLTIGIGATLAGAWRRLAAPLVGGTLLTMLGVFLATGSDLRAIPIWVWLGAGGAVLIGAAVMIERSGRSGWSGMMELVSRWD